MGEGIRLFDAFQFSEPHEASLLLAKFAVESPLIEKWIVVENAFTFKGEPKDRHLTSVLDADRRFDEFRDRIVQVSLDHNFHAEYRQSAANRGKLLAKHLLPGYDRDRATALFREYPGHYAEGSQRDAVLAHLFDVSDGEGWVVVSDVDEFVDCSTAVRRDQIVDALRSGANVTRLRRQRFTFDIDNFCPATRFVGCASIAYLRERSVGLQSVRLGHDGFVPTLDALVYEYSFCYPRAAIDRKLATYVHSDPGATSVAEALECNHFFFRSVPKRIDPDLWYRRVPLERAGVPEYVLANADHLRTGNVCDDYEERRALRYPHLFGWETSHARLLR